MTDRAQHALQASRYAAETDRSQRPWNRLSLAELSASSRQQRASDPVGWSLLNLASADVPSSSSSVWENSSYMSDLQRRRRRQLRMASPSWSNNSDTGADRAESPPPSWQTQSLHGTQLSANVQRSEPALSLPSFSRRRSAADNSQPASNGLRSTLAGPVFHETSSLADVDLWPSRRERDGTSFTPVFLEDIENDAEEITSTGAEAGSTASIGGDTESIDADAEVRSADFELGSIGAEVLVSGSSGSGAEIGVIDPPPVRTQYESTDYGPSTSDMPNLRSGSGFGTSRTSERLAELADLRDRASQRRWRRFNQADLQDRGSHQSSSAAASNGSLRISDWLEFDWSGDFVPRRLPPRRDYREFSDWNSREHDTSAASDVPRLRDYVAVRSRRGRPSYSGSGAASNAGSYHPHECLPNCEICGGGRGRMMRHLNRYLSELASDRLPDNSSRMRQPSYETLAPAASAVEDDNSIVGSLAMLQQEMENTRSSLPSFSWRESSASSLDGSRFPYDPSRVPSAADFERRLRRLDERVSWRESSASSLDGSRVPYDPSRVPSAADFERRVRRLDERVSQMQRRLSMQAECEARPPSLGYRLRERQDMLRSQIEALHTQYRLYPSQVSDTLPSHRTYDDDLLPSSSSTAGYGNTGAEAVSEFVNMGQ